MRRDFSQPLLNLDGTEAKNASGEVVTLASVSLMALLNPTGEERNITAEQKTRRYQVAVKINKDTKKVDLTIEEMALLKECIGRFHGPLVVGRSYELLEQEPKAVVDVA